MSERLQKLLAGAGHGSRRSIEQWIREGRVTLNGRAAVLGDRAGREDRICLDGLPLDLGGGADRLEVLLYHKPVGEVTTRSDPQGRPTVFERLPPPASGRWIVVGRLDVNTSGVLLFTNDGGLAHRLMHPSSEIEREYRVRLRGNPPPAAIEQLRRGVELEDGPARFDRIEVERSEAGHSWFRVSLHEGRNREVRRMFEHLGFNVSRLIRMRYGSVILIEDSSAGGYKWLQADEVEQLTRLAGGAGVLAVPEAGSPGH